MAGKVFIFADVCVHSQDEVRLMSIIRSHDLGSNTGDGSKPKSFGMILVWSVAC